VIAMTIPATTKTTIAICIQIQVGDTKNSLLRRIRRTVTGALTIVCEWWQA